RQAAFALRSEPDGVHLRASGRRRDQRGRPDPRPRAEGASRADAPRDRLEGRRRDLPRVRDGRALTAAERVTSDRVSVRWCARYSIGGGAVSVAIELKDGRKVPLHVRAAVAMAMQSLQIAAQLALRGSDP